METIKHPSMKRPKGKPPNGPLKFFLWNTRPLDLAKQWTAYPSKVEALQAAQEIIDGADASSWLWIEDGQEIHISEHARPDWGLSLYEGIEDALDAIAFLDGPQRALNNAAIILAQAGEEPPKPLPSRKISRKRKPVKS